MPSTAEQDERPKRESRFILMPKSNQLARMELEMALRGYQRICTLHRLQPLPCSGQTQCREAYPSSQYRPRRARTMRRRGETREHTYRMILLDPLRSSGRETFVSTKRAGTHAGKLLFSGNKKSQATLLPLSVEGNFPK